MCLTLIGLCHMRRSRKFFSGGPGPTARKQSEGFLFFLVLNLFYSSQRVSNGFITEKTILFQGSRGSPTFSRGGEVGVQMLISIETHITCDFPSGVWAPYPPLWIRTCANTFCLLITSASNMYIQMHTRINVLWT